MKKSSKVLLLTIFTYFSCAQCHEILNDFLDFNERSAEVHLTKECSDHLRLIKSGIESNKIWAIKGKERQVKSDKVSDRK